MRLIIIATFFFSSFKLVNAPMEEYNPPKVVVVETSKIESHKLDDLISALVRVESNGDTLAVNPVTGASGPLQILPILIDDVNRIANIKDMDKHFTKSDVWSLEKSREMFIIYTEFYSKNSSYEVISRRWNGGPTGERKPATKPYWQKVKRFL